MEVVGRTRAGEREFPPLSCCAESSSRCGYSMARVNRRTRDVGFCSIDAEPGVAPDLPGGFNIADLLQSGLGLDPQQTLQIALLGRRRLRKKNSQEHCQSPHERCADPCLQRFVVGIRVYRSPLRFNLSGWQGGLVWTTPA